mmetsp:Transcript_28527/g.60198  ORF Transcript_28527/g.60198 Transcript_28527/m.60198 type:complete len:183 (-) Transcript_28527:698-1246(-)
MVVYSREAFLRLLTDASYRVWDVSSLRPNQEEALLFLFDPSKPRNLLLVERTGGGETHITRVAGVIERGIVPIIIPLLSLSADQMEKFKDANQAYGAVDTYHMDELFKESASKYGELLHRIRKMDRKTTSTIFLFTSHVCNDTRVPTQFVYVFPAARPMRSGHRAIGTMSPYCRFVLLHHIV